MKMTVNISTMLIIILGAALLFTAKVSAHIPLDTDAAATREVPVEVEDHKISWAAYNILEDEDEVHYYRFSASAGEEIYASMLVPRLERLENYHPDYALIGPGLENNYSGMSSEEIKSRLIIEGGEGVIVQSYERDVGEESETFFEHFTRTEYWTRQESTIAAPETGTYYLAVFSRQNQTGKYVFSIGRQEKWGISDIIRLPGIWWNVRMFMEKESSTYAITGAIGAAAALIVYRLLKN